MKKLFLSLAAIVVSGSIAASAANTKCSTITIFTGSDTGAYFNATGPNAAYNIEKFGEDKGVKNVKIVVSKGTVDNLNQVLNTPCSIGIGESYAIMQEMDKNEKVGNLSFLGDAGKEMFGVVYNTKYPDNPGKKAIMIGSKGSGTYADAQYLMAQEKNTWINSVKTKESSYKASTIMPGVFVTGGMFVVAPDPENEKIKQVLKSPKLDFLHLTPENTDLGEYGQGEDALFTFEEFNLGKDKDGDEYILHTAAVQTMFFYNPEMVDPVFESIADKALVKVSNIKIGMMERAANWLKEQYNETQAKAWKIKDSL